MRMQSDVHARSSVVPVDFVVCTMKARVEHVQLSATCMCIAHASAPHDLEIHHYFSALGLIALACACRYSPVQKCKLKQNRAVCTYAVS